MPAEEVVATLKKAWDVLGELHIPAALMGGLALANWNYIRSTQDVDMLIALTGVRPQTLLPDWRRRAIDPNCEVHSSDWTMQS